MPSPNQPLGGSQSARDDGGGHPYYYVESTETPACSTSKTQCRGNSEALLSAKKEIRRLREAIRTLEACVKSRSPDTSAAWKAEAEQLRAELARYKKDKDLLLHDLSAARDALAHQIAADKSEAQEAAAQEAKRWKERLRLSGQEADDLQRELSQTLSRVEELEAAKATAIFELAEERSKPRPRGIDPALHDETLTELSTIRHRLTHQEAEWQKAAEKRKAEAATAVAELQQNIAYLKRVVKEQMAELALASEAAAEADAKLTGLAADHKRQLAKAEALQQENEMLSGLHKQWEAWSLEVESMLQRDARQESSTSRELGNLKIKVKELEDKAERSALDAQRRMSQLASSTPKALIRIASGA